LKFFSYGFGGEQSFCALKALLSKEAVFGGASQLAETLDIDCGQDVKYLPISCCNAPCHYILHQHSDFMQSQFGISLGCSWKNNS